jgi:tRNA (guanine37-N1)-methyltransferase
MRCGYFDGLAAGCVLTGGATAMEGVSEVAEQVLGIPCRRGAPTKIGGLVDVAVHDLRAFTADRHRTVDDVPFGGGPGMVLKAEPLFRAVDHVRETRGPAGAVVLTSPQGARFSQASAERLRGLGHVVILCGRYEGVDDRVRAHLATEEISIGDYVLSGGELAAAVVIDAVARLLPGVLGNEASAVNESFSGTEAAGILDCPQYTRPAEFRGWKVPDVLMSGHHEEIRRWRREAALEKTRRLRPDLLAREGLPEQELVGQESGKHNE